MDFIRVNLRSSLVIFSSATNTTNRVIIKLPLFEFTAPDSLPERVWRPSKRDSFCIRVGHEFDRVSARHFVKQLRAAQEK
jgi:hypothetical protein